MRNNRRKKRLINSLKMVASIKNIEIGLKTSKRLLLLTTRESAKIYYNESYFDQDKYNIDPRMFVKIDFVNL